MLRLLFYQACHVNCFTPAIGHAWRPGEAMKTSAHHGDADAPNELNAARLIEGCYADEIQIYEIDFVTLPGGDVVSSHDYESEAIARGSSLAQWIEFVVARGKRLWIDAKQNLAWFDATYGRFDVDALFSQLETQRHRMLQLHGVSLADHLWIGCQFPDLFQEIVARNEAAGNRWTLMLDMPSISNYVLQWIVPDTACCWGGRWLRERVKAQIRAADTLSFSVLAIDQSFFRSPKRLAEFVRSLDLPTDYEVVLYTFPRSVPPIDLPGLRVTMQYDFT